jgi:uncharacterized protein YutE (UPF0331/DUF86 family)
MNTWIALVHGPKGVPMVVIEKVLLKFAQLDEYVGVLNKISETPEEGFVKDKILMGSAKYYLQVSIECCLDVANHVIATEHFRAPRDYADSFKVLEEEGVISSEVGNRLGMAAKFRNRLVHLYGDIDDAYVYQFMKEDLTDLLDYKSAILQKYGHRS